MKIVPLTSLHPPEKILLVTGKPVCLAAEDQKTLYEY